MKSLNLYIFLAGFLTINILNMLSSGSLIIMSFYYRIFTVLLAVMVILVLFLKEYKTVHIVIHSSLFKLYLVFAFLYILRLYVDRIFLEVNIPSSSEATLDMFVSVSYILVIPLSLISTGSFDNGRFLKYYLWAFSGLFIINALYNPVMFGKVEERMSTLENLGSQGIGLYASILFVWSTTLFITLNNLIGKMILMLIILISIFYLAVSATRSVFSGAILVTLLFIIQNRKKLVSQYIFAFVLFIGVLISTMSLWGKWLNLILIRLQKGIESGTTGRQNIWPQAVEMFNSSPLWGNYHIIPDRTYFHNFFLDAYVSTGLIGGLIFTVLNIKIITICLRWLRLESKPEYRFYSIGFLLVFIFGMFSQALYSTSFYWGFLMLIIVFSAHEDIHNTKRYETTMDNINHTGALV